MASDGDDSAKLLDLATRLLAEVNDLKDLQTAFGRGEISKEQLVKEMAVRYHREFGSTVMAVAEIDQAAAVAVTEKLRGCADEQLEVFARRGGPGPRKDLKSAGADNLKDRDDDVLVREFVILTAVSKANAPVRSAEIFAVVKKLDASLSENVITANLARMVNLGVLGKHGKGKYEQVVAGSTQLAALASEIGKRGLKLPSV